MASPPPTSLKRSAVTEQTAGGSSHPADNIYCGVSILPAGSGVTTAGAGAAGLSLSSFARRCSRAASFSR
ncbi:hypothetical protein COLO4_02086, partial [Corchorus olitorius]